MGASMTKREVPDLPGFNAWWAAWPKNVTGGYSRKAGKNMCLTIWARCHHESQAETILRHVEWLKTTADWLKDGGAYIPMPITYLRQQRWDGADIPEPGAPVPQSESPRAREARERVERIAPGAAARRPGAKQPQWEVIDDASQPRIGG